jgi:hypothetical protein
LSENVSNAAAKLAAIVDHDNKRPDIRGAVVAFDQLKTFKAWRQKRRVLVMRLMGPVRGYA